MSHPFFEPSASLPPRDSHCCQTNISRKLSMKMDSVPAITVKENGMDCSLHLPVSEVNVQGEHSMSSFSLLSGDSISFRSDPFGSSTPIQFIYPNECRAPAKGCLKREPASQLQEEDAQYPSKHDSRIGATTQVMPAILSDHEYSSDEEGTRDKHMNLQAGTKAVILCDSRTPFAFYPKVADHARGLRRPIRQPSIGNAIGGLRLPVRRPSVNSFENMETEA